MSELRLTKTQLEIIETLQRIEAKLRKLQGRLVEIWADIEADAFTRKLARRKRARIEKRAR